jgi:outer membrane receptor protein involved in Fe transport
LVGGSVLTAEGGLTRIENRLDGLPRFSTGRSDRPWARVAWMADDFNVTASYTGHRADQFQLGSGSSFDNESSRLQVEGQGQRRFAAERGRIVLGASARTERIDSKGTLLAPEADGRSDESYALFGQLDFELAHNLDLVLAARWDESSLFDAEVAPKAGLVWSPVENQSWRVTYGLAYLMPSATQRFVRLPLGPPTDLSALEAGLRASPLGPSLAGVTPGTLFNGTDLVQAFALGNEELGPERVQSYELGYKGQFERVFLTADIHLSRFEDFTTPLLPGVNPAYGPWTAPASVPVPAQDALETAVNSAVPGLTLLPGNEAILALSQAAAGEAREVGFEVSLGVQATDEIELDGNYSYSKVDFEEGTFLGGDSIPTNFPTHRGNVAVTWNRSDLRARVGLTLVDGFHTVESLWSGFVPSQQTVDVSAQYRLSGTFRAGLSATNVLDQRRHRTFGGSLIGRRVLVSLTWQR